MSRIEAEKIKVLLIDDHEIVRAGLRILINSHPRLELVGETAGQSEALTLASAVRPDVILLDLDLGDSADGLTLLPQLREATPESRVIILTGLRDEAVHRQAVRLGARGVVLKEKAHDLIIKAVEKVHAGELWLDRSTTADVLRDLLSADQVKQTPEQEGIARLTEREREVISLVSEGLKNKQIAARLYISETTVTHHLTSIFGKLEVPDRLGLIIFAYRHQLAKP